MKRQNLRIACAAVLLLLSGVSLADQGQGKSSHRDPETARLFNGKVTIVVNGDLPQASQVLIGREVSKEMIAKLVGAPDRATVTIHANNNMISVGTTHQYYKYQSRTITNQAGRPAIYNASFGVELDAPAGVATRVLAHEVATARELGFEKITVSASGFLASSNNGYYTWPRLGFNAPIPSYMVLPENLRSATDMNSLMSLPEGPEWWKAHGNTTHMEFDLSPTSTATQVHEAYLKSKGISIHE